MHCHSCEVLLKDVATDVKGVEPLGASHSKGTLTIKCEDDAQIAEVKKLIEKEGYKVVE